MMRTVPGHGLIVDGHDISRTDVLADAAAELGRLGMPVAEVEEALLDRRGLVTRAWWDGIGFVQSHHAGAMPVTVVNVPPPVPA